MRYDLEFNITSKLTQDGLNLLSETLFGESNIVPAFWDKNSLTSQFSINSGQLDLSRYNKKKFIDDEFISSGVNLSTEELSLYGKIINKDFITTSFNGGMFSSNRSKFQWSKNSIVKSFAWEDGFYKCEVDPDIDTNKISISTFTFDELLFYKNKKTFYYIPPTLTFDTLEENLAETFKGSTQDFKFTIIDNVAILSCKRLIYSGNLLSKAGNRFILPEFPVSNLKIETTRENYTYQEGSLLFEDTSVDNVVATFEVLPVISFLSTTRVNEDVVFNNLNLHPRLLNYKNGTLCIRPNFNSLDSPKSLIVTSNKSLLFGSEIAKVNIKLLGAGDLPLSGKDVTVKIKTKNAQFSSSSLPDKSEIKLKTYVDGEISTDLIANTGKVGFYIQKEWVDSVNKKIKIPFQLSSSVDIKRVYLYIITADDPFLGKKNILAADGEGFIEKYATDKISSYETNGRKIAFVSLEQSEDLGTVTSKFIKPLSVTAGPNLTNQRINFKNMAYNSDGAGSNQLISDILPSSAYASSTWSYIPEYITELTYPKMPSSDNIASFWLITDSLIEIEASYEDAETSITSEPLLLTFQNIKSENSFTLNKYSSAGPDSRYGSFGYYTMTEYLKNPYGLNAFSYYCMHSDCVYKKCIHPDLSNHKYFLLDSGRVGCSRNKDFEDENNGVGTDNIGRCPGMDANLINPFTMHTEIT